MIFNRTVTSYIVASYATQQKTKTSVFKNCKFKNEVGIYATKSSETRDE